MMGSENHFEVKKFCNNKLLVPNVLASILLVEGSPDVFFLENFNIDSVQWVNEMTKSSSFAKKVILRLYLNIPKSVDILNLMRRKELAFLD